MWPTGNSSRTISSADSAGNLVNLKRLGSADDDGRSHELPSIVRKRSLSLSASLPAALGSAVLAVRTADDNMEDGVAAADSTLSKSSTGEGEIGCFFVLPHSRPSIATFLSLSSLEVKGMGPLQPGTQCYERISSESTTENDSPSTLDSPHSLQATERMAREDDEAAAALVRRRCNFLFLEPMDW